VANGNPFTLRNSPFAIRKARNEQQRQSAGGGTHVFVLVTPRKNIGGETPTDARLFYRAARARPRLDRQAHIYRRSTAALVPRSLSSQGTQHQAFASWDVAARVGLSVERALPAPTCPSPARSSRPGRSAEGLMPNAARERVASPRAGAALAPDLRPAGRSPSDRARSEQCNLFSDICQAASLSQ
jgi:hypothetical protein